MTALIKIMNHEFRIMIFVLFMILASIFMIHPVSAQSATSSTWEESKPTSQVFQALPTSVSPVSPLYTDLLVNNLFHSFSCLAIGQSVIGQPCLTYQITKNAQGMVQSVPMLSSVNLSGGTLGATTSLIGALYANPPVRTIDYLASVGYGLGIVKTANAQVVGSGAAVLNPILTLWQVSRNISYVIMIIIFLIIGLMVMFRNKINPQTVITAQAALPGLVIGLIMITFSFFFAGLISDMAFVGTNIVGYYFSAARGHPGDQNLVDDFSKKNILSLFGNFVGIVDNAKADKVASIIYDNVGSDAQGKISLLTSFFATQFVAPIANATGNTVNQLMSAIKRVSKFSWIGIALSPIVDITTGIIGLTNPAFTLSFLLAFIATIALVYQMIQLLLKLVTAYLIIIFLTITAPFQFLFAALPGRQGIATGWMLRMLANILVFPAVIAVLYFVALILGRDFVQHCADLDPNKTCVFKISQASQSRDSSLITPAYVDEVKIIDTQTFPLFGGLNLEIIQLLLAFGALMALPRIPDIVIASVGKAGQAGQMIGQEIGSGIGQGQRFANQFQGAATTGITNVKQGIFGERSIGPMGTPIQSKWGILQHYKDKNP